MITPEVPVAGKEVPSVAGEQPAVTKTVAEQTETDRLTSEREMAFVSDKVAGMVNDNEAHAKILASLKNGGGEVGSSVEAGEEENKDEKRGVAYTWFNKMKDVFHAEAEVALSQNDMPGFQSAYVKMMENKITELEFRIQGGEADFNDGSFQKNFREYHAASADDAYIQGVYDYQKKTMQDQIQSIREYSIKAVQENPQNIITRDKFRENQDKIGLLAMILKEADGYILLEKNKGAKKGGMYPNAGAQVEGAVAAALRYKDPKVLAYLKNTFNGDLPRTMVTLPAELQEQIVALKV